MTKDAAEYLEQHCQVAKGRGASYVQNFMRTPGAIAGYFNDVERGPSGHFMVKEPKPSTPSR